MQQAKTEPSYVAKALGNVLTSETLPCSRTSRWLPRQKAQVVAAVEGGLLSLDEACERYNLTLEEFASWQRSIERAGLAGLRVTHVQHYRDEWQRRGC